VGLDIDAERLIADYLGSALFAVLGVFAWLAIVAHRAEKARGLIELCCEAVKMREGQEKLKADKKAAPFLEQTRRAEADIRILLRRYGLETAPEEPRPSARPVPARR
jgi:hypothetical protein